MKDSQDVYVGQGDNSVFGHPTEEDISREDQGHRDTLKHFRLRCKSGSGLHSARDGEREGEREKTSSLGAPA